MSDLIDADLANALGCPEMKSGKGQMCAGTGAPLQGYNFRLKVTPSAPGQAAAFSALGFSSLPPGTQGAGCYSFFVDQTQVIRVSDSPAVLASAMSPALGSPGAPEIR